MAEIEHLPPAPSTITDGALAELERLTRLIESLSPRDWSRPSAVEAWTVGDVIAHLALFLGLYSRLLAPVLAGRRSSTLANTIAWLTASAMPATGSVFDPINSAIPKVMRRTVRPEVLKGLFAASARETRERLLRVDPAKDEGSLHPLSFYLAIPVGELAIHRWDIASTIEQVAGLSEDARHILPWFYWSGTRLMLRLPKGITGTVQVLLSEPESAMWWSIAGGRMQVGRETAPNPDVTIQGPSEHFVLTLAGRLEPAEVLHSQLTVEGDHSLAEHFLLGWHLL